MSDDGPNLEQYKAIGYSFEMWSMHRRSWAALKSKCDRLYPFKPTNVSVFMGNIPLVQEPNQKKGQ